jgi:hypothetical protein
MESDPMKKLLLLVALLLAPVAASAQCNGIFPNNTICGNVSGASNLPRPLSNSVLTGVPGGINGQVQYNNAGVFGGLTNAQLTALCQQFTSVLSGCVPLSGGGTTTFLRADGSWAAPPSVLLSGTILAKTALYTAVTGDCGKTITLGGTAQYTLTLTAASGYVSTCGFIITNLASETRTKTLAINGLTSFFIYPGQSVTIANESNVWVCVSGCVRYKSPGTLAFFIRPDGSDSNDGLANSAAGAYLTANACMAAIATNIDINQQSVGCQHTCAAPPCVITTVAQMLNLTGTSFVGGSPYYIGDTITPSNVDFNPSSAVNADIQITFPKGGGVINIGGFKFRGGANTNHGVYVSGGGQVNFIYPTMFTLVSSAPAGGWPAGCGVTANSGGYVYLNATMFFNAAIGSPFCAMNHGFIENGSSVTVDVLGGVWGSGFVSSKWGGVAALTLLFTNPGAVTGNRCNIAYGGVVYTNGGGATFFPGNVDCSTAAGTVADAAGNRGNYN